MFASCWTNEIINIQLSVENVLILMEIFVKRTELL